MTLIDFLQLFGVAGLAGAINSVAGGGTFLTFPVLMLLGLSPVQANVTSTVALWPGSVASAVAYRKEWMSERARLPLLLLISLTGSGLGAWTLMVAPERVFEHLVPWLLLVATLIFAFGQHILRRAAFLQRPAVARAVQFIIAFYGGYFGAGIGILMLAMLQLLGETHIHRMNALKTVLGSAINAVAVGIFIVMGGVVWDVGLVMLAGAVLGGFAGAHYAQKVDARHIRRGVLCVAVGMTAWFFLHG